MSTTLAGLTSHLEAAAKGGLAQTLATQLRSLALEAEAAAKKNATTSPRVRSGILRRSIVGALEGSGDTLTLSLSAGRDGPASSYAAIQEYGGEVKPTRGRFLAIPVGPARTAAGVPRFRSAREVPGLRFVAIHGGSMGLLVKDGKKGQSETWFVLVRRVRVPAARYLTRALEEIRTVAAERIQLKLGEVVHAG